MKIQILDKEGKKIAEKETPLFEEPIREDIICKVAEAEKIWHPYSTKPDAGMRSSAAGKLRHRRHVWKSDRGRGLSRLPRKIFWRRGSQFAWEGAIVPQARGGRRAHPPKGKLNLKKINKKEFKKALLSCLSYVSNLEELKKKYSSIKDKEIKTSLPLVVEGSILSLKTKEFFESLKKILKELYDVAIQKKSIRAGKGKMRGRKYKKTAGMLLVIGKDEEAKFKGIDIVKTNELIVRDLASNGARLTMFTEKSIEDLEKIFFKEKKEKEENAIKKNKKDSKEKSTKQSKKKE